MGKDIT